MYVVWMEAVVLLYQLNLKIITCLADKISIPVIIYSVSETAVLISLRLEITRRSYPCVDGCFCKVSGSDFKTQVGNKNRAFI